MTRIVICRHTNTFDKGDVIRRVGARTDMALSSSGRLQAETLAAELAGFNFTKAFCSPLIRTQQTATAIIEASTSLEVLPFLTEIDYGVDENKSESDVIARLGQDVIDLWDLEAIPPQSWHIDVEGVIKSWRLFFDIHRNSGEDILVVTSNGIARFVLDVFKQVPIDTPRKLRTAAFGLVELGANKTELVYWDKRRLLD